MRITSLHVFRADGLWRPFSFLRIDTDAGLSGWAEFVEAPWAPALADVILALGRHAVGEDPRTWAQLTAQLRAITLFTAGGLSHQAVAAIQNACLDITGKHLGVPVYALFGGARRQSVKLYWSHCGSFRARDPQMFESVLGRPRLRTPDDLTALGKEAVDRGFRTVKTNPMVFAAQGPVLLNPGFAPQDLAQERTLDERTLDAVAMQCARLCEGLGHGRDLMLDVNFSLTPAALRRLAHRLPAKGLRWLEADVNSPQELAAVRAGSPVPIASLESLHGRRAYLPWLEAGAVDVAIVDVPWNGLGEAVGIASLADVFDVNVAPHNFYGPLADLMSAHFCAAVPNLEIMEIEADDVPWKHALLTRAPRIEAGRMFIPDAPGWGADIDEAVLRLHPWPRARVP
jgi:galactonate dehydratase